MGSKCLTHINQGKLKREELGGQRGLTLKLQFWRPLLFDAEGIEHFLDSTAFGRCCASSHGKLCAWVGQQERPCVSCCHEKVSPLSLGVSRGPGCSRRGIRFSIAQMGKHLWRATSSPSSLKRQLLGKARGHLCPPWQIPRAHPCCQAVVARCSRAAIREKQLCPCYSLSALSTGLAEVG